MTLEMHAPAPGNRTSVVDLLHERLEHPEHGVHDTRFRTGMFPLDDVLGGGLRPQDLVVLSGRPGAGKTIMALQWARAAARQGANAIYVCYEHGPESLLERFAALEAVSAEREARTGLHGQDFEPAGALMRPFGSLAPSELRLADTLDRAAVYGRRLSFVPGVGRDTNLDAIEQLVDRDDAGNAVLFVDYLQKIPTESGRFRNEDERSAHVVESLKDIALRMNIAVVAIVAAERDALRERRLRMHHMRGSSALMYEADIAIVLNEKHRAVSKTHLAYDSVRAESARRQIVLSLEKNRHGVADVDLDFKKDFANYAIDPAGTFLTEDLVDDVLFQE
jgi:replicative DNA helicase